jgi:hypothetical protein
LRRPTTTILRLGHRSDQVQYLNAAEAARLEGIGALAWCYACTDNERPPRDVYHLDTDGELCPTCRYPRKQGHACPHCDAAALVAQEPRP